MLFDELQEQVKQLQPDIDAIIEFWSNNKFDEHHKQLSDQYNHPDFWKHPDQIATSQRYKHLTDEKEQYETLIQSYNDLKELLALFRNDEAELKKIKVDLDTLSRAVPQFKVALLLNGPQDNNACFISVNAGAGGTESQDWAHMLLRMYVRFCERNKLTARLVDEQTGEEAGIKSATLHVKGRHAYGLLKGEHGIHRLVRISPFDSNKRRHTSFSGVHVVPEMPNVSVEINPKDIRIDTYRASGAGGQHVNKTDSAVRITHLPTGIVVQCQNERSQLQNKETAMKMLASKLAQRLEQERKKELSSVEKKKIEWGSQIRSYVLHPYKMVKDHRTSIESHQPDDVLDGGLIPFVEQYLIWSSTES